jgi:RNA polymerase sigma factor (sigma-70 family)
MGVRLPAFQTLVDAHWRDVARLAHALAGPAEADDVAQQAWAQAYAAYPSLLSGRNLRAWLLSITYRCAMDAHRARARRDAAHAAASAMGGGSSAGAGQPSPEDAWPEEELWQAVARLPQRNRHAVALRFVADLDHRAVAAALETTPTMSRRLVSDGLAALRRDLG